MIANPFKGKYVAFEGTDGSGKSAQFTRAKNILTAHGVDAVFVKEPVSPIIYDMLFGRHPVRNFKDMGQLERQQHYFRDRIQHYRKTVLPALEAGGHVISDRSLVSVVLDVERAGDLETLLADEERMFAEADVPFIRPDLVLIYDVPVEVAMERLGKKKRELDFFEQGEKIARTRQAYREFSEKFPDFSVIIDATDSEETVFAKNTRKLLGKIIELTEWR